MRVFLKPVGLHSHAMLRVERALEAYAPKSVEIVQTLGEADVRLLHVIGPTEIPRSKDYVVVQYCGSTTTEAYTGLWHNAKMVWSYYNLQHKMGKTPFLFAPLGVDKVFAGIGERGNTP